MTRGRVITDTLVMLTNDYPGDVEVLMYLVNGDPPLPADGISGERAHPGWNWLDNGIILTRDQPIWWSVATGAPRGLSPFEVLDPGMPPGRPAPPGAACCRESG